MEIEKKKTRKGVAFVIKGTLSGSLKSTFNLFETVSLELEKKPKKIILDLEKVLYVDSMSIGLLIGLLLKGKEKQIPIHFEKISEDVMKLFEESNLKKAFPDLY